MVLAGRLQVLPDRQKIDIGRPQIIHYLLQILTGFAEPHHQPRLGEERRIELLRPVEQPQAGVISRAGPYFRIELRYRLQSVVENVRPRLDDGFECARFAQEIRRQYLDRGLWRLRPDLPDHLRELSGAAVFEVVPVDGGDHDMLETELSDRPCDIVRLVWVEPVRSAGRDVAECARPGTNGAQDHHGGVPLRPTLADVGAARLFTHGRELVFADDPARLLIFTRRGGLYPDPGRLAHYRTFGAV